jgi:hypothetical protein
LALAGVTGHALNVIKATSLDKVFQLCPTVEQAWAAVNQ